ncbi:hypothetical protein H106_06647 [Trichophyton rubrum CBS 735.88]|nr:hypothetical protein H106_06647 [Trichophyton rubrum CBS 735.88]
MVSRIWCGGYGVEGAGRRLCVGWASHLKREGFIHIPRVDSKKSWTSSTPLIQSKGGLRAGSDLVASRKSPTTIKLKTLHRYHIRHRYILSRRSDFVKIAPGVFK